jgi:hypothetical protein
MQPHSCIPYVHMGFIMHWQRFYEVERKKKEAEHFFIFKLFYDSYNEEAIQRTEFFHMNDTFW